MRKKRRSQAPKYLDLAGLGDLRGLKVYEVLKVFKKFDNLNVQIIHIFGHNGAG